MPRYREPFTIFPRRLKSGKTIYYYRTYSKDGIRTAARSTGQTSRALARQYCAKLLEQGILYSGTGMTFYGYSSDFFSENSQWYLDKIQSGNGKDSPISFNTLKTYRYCVSSFLVPYFNKMKLCDIKPVHIKKFRANLIEQKLSNSVINLSCACLKIIFSYAKADGYMTINPFATIQQMYVNARSKSTFSKGELVETFNKKWESSERKLFAITATLTGMRISEIKAITKESLHEDYIDVSKQFYKGNFFSVKDDSKRKIRISKKFSCILKVFLGNNYFLFPETQDTYRRSFNINTHFSKDERDKRGFTFHSLRHFFNTYLLLNNIPESKVKYVMGHSSGKGSITERYTNFTPSDFDDVAAVQDKFLSLLNMS